MNHDPVEITIAGLPTTTCKHCAGLGRVASPVDIGAMMRKSRITSGLTMKQVGDRMGFKVPYICDLEKGRREWTGEKILNYASALLPKP